MGNSAIVAHDPSVASAAWLQAAEATPPLRGVREGEESQFDWWRSMDYVVILLLQIGSAIASLVLISIGLAVIFGMMRVINLAHGEFLMLGGYAAITAYNLGVNLWLAMVVVAPLVVGLFGALVERLVIRHLYGRLIDTMLATWGLSLAMIGFVTVVFGNTVSGISAPLGSVSIGAYRTGVYEIFLIVVAAILLIAGWLVLRFTRLGLIARGTMQNAVDGGRAGHQSVGGLCRDLRRRLGAVRPGRRASGAAHRRRADDRRGLYRQGLHHRDQRRRGDPLRHRHRRRPCSAPSTRWPPSPSPRCWARWRCWWRPSCCCACCRRASPAASSGGRCDQGPPAARARQSRGAGRRPRRAVRPAGLCRDLPDHQLDDLRQPSPSSLSRWR